MAIITAILLSAVLVGVGLVTIDAGRLYSERRQLQNGADAGALAVAQSCAAGSCVVSLAGPYADANANDGAAGVQEVCGTGPGLPACTVADAGNLTDCLPAGSTPYVKVRTRTRDASGSVIRSLFDGPDTTVGACARASWDGVRAADASLALTISLCEWTDATADRNGVGNPDYAAPPPYPPNPGPPAGAERVLSFHSGAAKNASACGGGPAGWDLPGGFGWLDSDESCRAVVDIADDYSADPGTSEPTDCKTVVASAQANKALLFLPVFDGQQGNGSNGTYTMRGWAAFVLTGYRFPGQSAKSWLTGRFPCAGSEQCISGYFTQGLVPDPIAAGGPAMGATAVNLSG